jgi:hypothetical protein
MQVVQWLSLALSNRPIRLCVSHPSSEDENRDPVSKMLCSFLFFNISDNGQSLKTQFSWVLHTIIRTLRNLIKMGLHFISTKLQLESIAFKPYKGCHDRSHYIQKCNFTTCQHCIKFIVPVYHTLSAHVHRCHVSSLLNKTPTAKWINFSLIYTKLLPIKQLSSGLRELAD